MGRRASEGQWGLQTDFCSGYSKLHQAVLTSQRTLVGQWELGTDSHHGYSIHQVELTSQRTHDGQQCLYL